MMNERYQFASTRQGLRRPDTVLFKKRGPQVIVLMSPGLMLEFGKYLRVPECESQSLFRISETEYIPHEMTGHPASGFA